MKPEQLLTHPAEWIRQFGKYLTKNKYLLQYFSPKSILLNTDLGIGYANALLLDQFFNSLPRRIVIAEIAYISAVGKVTQGGWIMYDHEGREHEFKSFDEIIRLLESFVLNEN